MIQPMVANFLISVHLWKVRNGLLFLQFPRVLRTWKFNKTCLLFSGYQRFKWDLLFFGGFRSKQIQRPRRTIFPTPSRPAGSSFPPPSQRARRRIGPRFGAANPLVLIYVLNVVLERPKHRSPSHFVFQRTSDNWEEVCPRMKVSRRSPTSFFGWFCGEEQGWKPLAGMLLSRRASGRPCASSSSSAPSAGLRLFP